MNRIKSGNPTEEPLPDWLMIAGAVAAWFFPFVFIFVGIVFIFNKNKSYKKAGIIWTTVSGFQFLIGGIVLFFILQVVWSLP